MDDRELFLRQIEGYIMPKKIIKDELVMKFNEKEKKKILTQIWFLLKNKWSMVIKKDNKEITIEKFKKVAINNDQRKDKIVKRNRKGQFRSQNKQQ